MAKGAAVWILFENDGALNRKGDTINFGDPVQGQEGAQKGQAGAIADRNDDQRNQRCHKNLAFRSLRWVGGKKHDEKVGSDCVGALKSYG